MTTQTIYGRIKEVVRAKDPYQQQVTIIFEDGFSVLTFDPNKVLVTL